MVIVGILTEASTTLGHIVSHITASLVLVLSNKPVSRLSFLLELLLFPQKLHSESIALSEPSEEGLDHDGRTDLNPASLGLLLSQVTLHESLYNRGIGVKVLSQF